MAYTAVDKIAQQSFNRIRDNRKRVSRQETLGVGLDALSGAIKSSYQSSLEDFQENSQLVEARAKREAAENKRLQMQKDISAADIYAGGYGKYLMDTYAEKEARAYLDARVNETKYTSDSYGLALEKIKEDMVYGEIGEDGKRKGGGMLDRFKAAAEATKKLGTLEKYDDYINRKLDYPESAGSYYIQKLWNNKSGDEINNIALQKLIDANGLDQGTSAFNIAYQAFNSGLSLDKTEMLLNQTNQYLKQYGKVTPKKVLETKYTYYTFKGKDGQQMRVPIIQQKVQLEGTTEIQEVEIADPRSAMSIAAFGTDKQKEQYKKEFGELPKLEFQLNSQAVKKRDPRTNLEFEEIQTTVQDVFSGKIIAGTNNKQRLTEDSQKQLLMDASKIDDTLVDQHINHTSELLSTQYANDNYSYGENIYNEGFNSRYKSELITGAERDTLIKLGRSNYVNLGTNIGTSYFIGSHGETLGLDLGRYISAQMAIEDNVYIAENGSAFGSYPGSSISTDENGNGVRVLAALDQVLKNPQLRRRFYSTKEHQKGIDDAVINLLSSKDVDEFLDENFNTNRTQDGIVTIADGHALDFFFKHNAPQNYSTDPSKRVYNADEAANSLFTTIIPITDKAGKSTGEFTYLYDMLAYKANRIGENQMIRVKGGQQKDAKTFLRSQSVNIQDQTPTESSKGGYRTVPLTDIEELKTTKAYKLLETLKDLNAQKIKLNATAKNKKDRNYLTSMGQLEVSISMAEKNIPKYFEEIKKKRDNLILIKQPVGNLEAEYSILENYIKGNTI